MDAQEFLAAVKSRFPQALGAHAWRGDATLTLRREDLLAAAKILKEDPAFRMDFLMDLTAVDYSTFGKKLSPALFASSGVKPAPDAGIADADPWPGPPAAARFAVVYHFFSSPLRLRLRLVVGVEESDPEVDSLTPLWGGANWLEREVWDMFGIRFRGHPGLTRILMYDGFTGHPLRKDYPVNKRQPLIGPMH